MKRKDLTIYTLILVMISCKGVSHDPHQAPASTTDPTAGQPPVLKSCDTTAIGDNIYNMRNDRVVSAALGTIMSCRSLDSLFRDAKKVSRTSPNQYDHHLVDTTVIYHIDCDSVTYLGSQANCFPLRLNIQSGRLSLDSGAIQIGMTKQAFVERYQLKKDVPDIIKMSDLERSNEFLFFFVHGVLTKFVYNNLYAE